MLKKKVLIVLLVSVLAGPIAALAADLVFGDFEKGLDGWIPSDKTYLFSYPKGATSGQRALMIIAPKPGWQVAARIKFQDVYKKDPEGLKALAEKWMVARTLELDLTIDPSNWLGRPGPNQWVNVSVVSNTETGGWVTLPAISDSVNPNTPGGWDPVNFPKTKTRHIVYDLTGLNAKLWAAGGPGVWFEVLVILNSGGFEAGGTIYIDNVKLAGFPKVTWVSFHGADDQPSGGAAGAGFTSAPDKGYTDLLASVGYEVTRYVTTGTPDVNLLNASDLVIVGRSVSSGHYQNVSATTWNTQVSVPMIITGGYVLRKNRLGLMTGNTIPDTVADINLTVTDPTHPIFRGVGLVDSNMVNPYAGIVTYPEGTTAAGTVARGISVVTDPPDDEAKVIATISADGSPAGGVIIAEYPAGATVVHDGGAGTDVLAGPRLVLLTGSREAQGISSETAGIYDLYADGARIFLNAVKYMLTRPEPVTLVNPSFEQPGIGKIKGWNGEGIGDTPAEDIPGWATDGPPVDSGVETGWGATDGEYTGFLKAKDPLVYQLTEYVIKPGDVFTLKVDAKNNWQATKFMLILYYDDMGLQMPAAAKEVTLTDTMTEYTLVFFADYDADCIGKRIGIALSNSSPVADSWVGFDNVRLLVKSVLR